MSVLLLLFIFIVSATTTGWLRRYALRQSLLDIPNERSSHTRPTPRGGGLSITLLVLISIPLLTGYWNLPVMVLLGVLPAGLLTGMIGWLDDHHHLAAPWRCRLSSCGDLVCLDQRRPARGTAGH